MLRQFQAVSRVKHGLTALTACLLMQMPLATFLLAVALGASMLADVFRIDGLQVPLRMLAAMLCGDRFRWMISDWTGFSWAGLTLAVVAGFSMDEVHHQNGYVQRQKRSILRDELDTPLVIAVSAVMMRGLTGSVSYFWSIACVMKAALHWEHVAQGISSLEQGEIRVRIALGFMTVAYLATSRATAYGPCLFMAMFWTTPDLHEKETPQVCRWILLNGEGDIEGGRHINKFRLFDARCDAADTAVMTNQEALQQICNHLGNNRLKIVVWVNALGNKDNWQHDETMLAITDGAAQSTILRYAWQQGRMDIDVFRGQVYSRFPRDVMKREESRNMWLCETELMEVEEARELLMRTLLRLDQLVLKTWGKHIEKSGDFNCIYVALLPISIVVPKAMLKGVKLGTKTNDILGPCLTLYMLTDRFIRRKPNPVYPGAFRCLIVTCGPLVGGPIVGRLSASLLTIFQKSPSKDAVLRSIDHILYLVAFCHFTFILVLDELVALMAIPWLILATGL